MKQTARPARQARKIQPAYGNSHAGVTIPKTRKPGGTATSKKRASQDGQKNQARYFDDAFFGPDDRTDHSEEFIHPLPHADFDGQAAYEDPETAWSVDFSPKKKNSLDAYLSSLEKYRPLSKAEEQQAARAHAEARIRLINHLGRCPAVVERILGMCEANANHDAIKQITLCREAYKTALDAMPGHAGVQPPHASTFQSEDASQRAADLKRSLNQLRIRSAVLISAVKSLGSPRQSQLQLETDTPGVPTAEKNTAKRQSGAPIVADPQAGMSAEEFLQFALTARELEGRWIEARNKLVEPNLRFVVHQVRKMACPGMPLADLIAEGNQALIDAADSFDPSKNIKFCSYAGTFLQRQVTRAADDKGRLIRMPVHACTATRKIYAVNRRLTQQLALAPTDFEIAVETGFTVEKVRELLTAAMPPMSIHEERSEDGEQTLEDLLPDQQDWKSQFYGPDGMTPDTLRTLLAPLMPLLSEYQQLVMAAIHGLNDAPRLTEEEAAPALNMTINQIRAHHAGALLVIENHFRSGQIAAA